MQKILLAGVGLVSILALQSNTCLGQDRPDYTSEQAASGILSQPPAALAGVGGTEAPPGKCDPNKLVDGPEGPVYQKCEGSTAGVVLGDEGEIAAGTAAAAGAADVVERPSKSKRTFVSAYRTGYNLKLTFDTGSTELSEHDKLNAQQLAQALNGGAASVQHLLIAGYTDESGTATSNETLSQRRAEAAKDYLVSLGVASERLEAKGFGPIPGLKNDPAHRRVVARKLD